MNKVNGKAVVAAFTEDQAERLTGVSCRQLRYWVRTNFFLPSIESGRHENAIRLYSFRDLVSLRVLAELRNTRRISLQHLRGVKERLSHLGDDLWAKTTLYVLGKEVVFVNPETKVKESVISGQGVLEIPLKVVTGDMKQAVAALRQRDEELLGTFAQHRGRAHNQLVVAGTRIPVRSIKAFADDGCSVDQILREYPTLTRVDVEAAIHYEPAV
ncbi:DUF433 domain-containing protein [Jiella sp. MQZ9-1]|uniref:DUF433 domain-containing protein n=1 Tax=Jiella flava TaxID=2816857 RepID=A0A939G206_9HYPH|nr:DUF433 domain-containing protein [Jiella flava]MBO0663599.1 DUF433 domain-containing protein [Jiella flava]MCD2472174.1 DUF433 domain-containing protein [Jiella flava]